MQAVSVWSWRLVNSSRRGFPGSAVPMTRPAASALCTSAAADSSSAAYGTLFHQDGPPSRRLYTRARTHCRRSPPPVPLTGASPQRGLRC